MSTATVKIDKIEPKSGNKPAKLFDGNGVDYITFKDGLAAEVAGFSVGDQVTITFEEQQKGTYTNRLLESIEKKAAEDSGGDSSMSKQEWAEKDLRINRCAVWKAILPTAMDAGLKMFYHRNPDGFDAGQLGGFVQRYGQMLREIAEADIYLPEPVQTPDEWIPFEEPS